MAEVNPEIVFATDAVAAPQIEKVKKPRTEKQLATVPLMREGHLKYLQRKKDEKLAKEQMTNADAALDGAIASSQSAAEPKKPKKAKKMEEVETKKDDDYKLAYYTLCGALSENELLKAQLAQGRSRMSRDRDEERQVRQRREEVSEDEEEYRSSPRRSRAPSRERSPVREEEYHRGRQPTQKKSASRQATCVYDK